jgi:hypothetical protein
MYSAELVKAIQIAINARVPMWIWGPTGVGKSSIIRMVAKATERDLIDQRPVMQDPVDVGGLPVVKDGYCHRVLPSWLPKHGNTLMVIEELPDAPMSVQCAYYQLILERQLSDYHVPDGAYICATGNRAQDGGNYNQPPAPLLNRFLHITLESGYDSWAGWAAKGDANMTVDLIPAKPITPHIRPELRAFFAFRKNLLVQKPIKSEFAFCTPRSVEMLSRILDQEPSDDIASDLINGLIGMGVGIEFLGFLRTWRSLPLISAIVANPMAVDIPTDLSACYATAVYLAANWKPANGDALCQYVRRLAPEYGCLFLRDLDARNKEAMASRGVIAMLNLPQFNDLMF